MSARSAKHVKEYPPWVNIQIVYYMLNELITHTMSSEGKAARPLTSSTSSML